MNFFRLNVLKTLDNPAEDEAPWVWGPIADVLFMFSQILAVCQGN
jgi:hypothetical protein